MDKYEEVLGILDGLNEDELIALHNDFVENYGDDSDHIYYMNEADFMIDNCDDGGIAEIAEILENDDEDNEEIA